MNMFPYSVGFKYWFVFIVTGFGLFAGSFFVSEGIVRGIFLHLGVILLSSGLAGFLSTWKDKKFDSVWKSGGFFLLLAGLIYFTINSFLRFVIHLPLLISAPSSWLMSIILATFLLPISVAMFYFLVYRKIRFSDMDRSKKRLFFVVLFLISIAISFLLFRSG